MRVKDIIAIVIIILVILSTLFILPYESFECYSGTCYIYEKHGYLSKEYIKQQFRQRDVASYEITSHTHRHSKNSSYHDVYEITIYLNNGLSIYIPREFCRDKSYAEDYAKYIKKGMDIQKR